MTLELLKLANPPLNWAIPSAGILYEGHGRRKVALFACLISGSLAVHSFTVIRDDFVRGPSIY